MGADIHINVEVRRDGVWEYISDVELFNCRNYGMFGFLADVRNYSHVPVIAQPRGVPDDASTTVRTKAEWQEAHSHSWLTAAELLAHDYERVFWNRRITKRMLGGGMNGAALAEEGEGEHLTIRAFLGEWFFEQLDKLTELGASGDVRLVFWFDS